MQNELKAKIALKVQRAAGERYSTLLFYESLCKFLAWFTLIVGILVGVVVVVQMANYAREVETLITGCAWFVSCALSWLSLMVSANMIRAFVDIAVNSFVSVELQKLD
ncbi:MAG TPA: hypothetical protein EYG51_10915 [Pseudomonadales bacterium]|nr:hypothetical protein [Pseudomonadales bacterium]